MASLRSQRLPATQQRNRTHTVNYSRTTQAKRVSVLPRADPWGHSTSRLHIQKEDKGGDRLAEAA